MAARPFYGWIVVGAAFACMLVIFGSAYSFAAFFESFTQEFSAQRADVALVFGLSGLLYFVLGAPAGDRKSTRLNSSHPSRSRMPSSA